MQLHGSAGIYKSRKAYRLSKPDYMSTAPSKRSCNPGLLFRVFINAALMKGPDTVLFTILRRT